MSSTPPRNQQSNQSAEPTTPGWNIGLFAMFSSAKKAPRSTVEISTESTGAAVSSPPAGGNGFVANGIGRGIDHVELKTPSERRLPSASNNTYGRPIDLLDSSSPTTMNGSNLSSSSTAAMSRAKSPWKSSRVRMNGSSVPRVQQQQHLKSPPVYSLSKTTKNRGLTPAKATAGKRRKRPPAPSVLLLSPRKRMKTTIDIDRTSKALGESKGLIMDASRPKQLQQYDTSIRPGRRIMGSQQCGSRANVWKRDDSVENQLTMETTERSNKRQKKVGFHDDDEAPVQSIIKSTPVRDSSTTTIGRQQTPYPKSSSSSSSGIGETSTSTPLKLRNPLPKIDLFVKGPPYTDFGSNEELETLGTTPGGTESLFASFGSASPAGTGISVSGIPLTYDDSNIPPMTDDEMPKSKDYVSDDSSDDDTPQAGPTQDKKRRKTGTEEPSFGPQGGGDLWKNWGEATAGSWQCQSCLLLNKSSLDKCQSCELPRDDDGGTGKTSGAAAAPSPAAPGSIGAGGFSMSAAPSSAAPGSIGAGGFSFQAPSASSSGNSGQSMFTFGAPAPSPATNSGVTTAGTTVGFQFGNASTNQANGSGVTTNGFVFPTPAAPSGTAASSTGAAAGTSSAFSLGNGNAKTEEGEIKESTTGGDAKSAAFSFGAGTAVSGSGDTTTGSKPVFGKKADSSTPENGNKFKFDLQGNQGTTSFNFGGGKKTTPEAKPSENRAPATEPAAKRTRPVSSEEKSQPNSASKATFGSTQPDASGNAAPKMSLFPGPAPFQFGQKPAGDAAPPAASSTTPNLFGGSTAATPTPSANSGTGPSSTPQIPPFAPATSGNNREDSDRKSKRRRGRGGDDESKTQNTASVPAAAGASSTPSFSGPFGNMSTPAAAPSTGPLFGSSTSTPGNGNASKPQDSSGAPQPFSFGSTAPAPGKPFVFGASSTDEKSKDQASSTTTSAGPFGGQPAPAPGPAAPFTSQPAAVPTTFGTNPARFGSVPSAPAPAAFGSTTFGTNPQSNTPAPATGSGFGSTPAAATGFGSTPAPATTATGFGSTPAPASTATGFGSNPAQQSNTSAPFGQTQSNAGPFGSATAPPAQFGSAPAGPFGANPSQSNPQAFGNTNIAGPQFGAAPSAPAVQFGSTSTAPNPAFGSTPAASAPAPFGQGSAPFGGSSAPAPFGATNAPFGGGGGFGGSNPAAPAAPGSFNTAAPQQPGGFGAAGGFGNSGSMANSNMGMGSGVQFSIGTGGKPANTRGRKIYKAKRPNRQA